MFLTGDLEEARASAVEQEERLRQQLLEVQADLDAAQADHDAAAAAATDAAADDGGGDTPTSASTRAERQADAMRLRVQGLEDELHKEAAARRAAADEVATLQQRVAELAAAANDHRAPADDVVKEAVADAVAGAMAQAEIDLAAAVEAAKASAAEEAQALLQAKEAELEDALQALSEEEEKNEALSREVGLLLCTWHAHGAALTP